MGCGDDIAGFGNQNARAEIGHRHQTDPILRNDGVLEGADRHHGTLNLVEVRLEIALMSVRWARFKEK